MFQDDIQPEFPDVFTKFIHTARLLSYPALSQVYSRADSICSTGRWDTAHFKIPSCFKLVTVCRVSITQSYNKKLVTFVVLCFVLSAFELFTQYNLTLIFSFFECVKCFVPYQWVSTYYWINQSISQSNQSINLFFLCNKLLV